MRQRPASDGSGDVRAHGEWARGVGNWGRRVSTETDSKKGPKCEIARTPVRRYESTEENMKESESRGARTPRGPVSSDDTTGQPQQQSALRRQKKEKEATALDAALASCAYVDSVIHRGGKVRYYWTRPVVRILLYGVNVFWCCVCRESLCTRVYSCQRAFLFFPLLLSTR